MNVNYIDLCSGIGGFRVAIEDFQTENPDIKFNCVLTADIKQDAIDTYNLNFNEQNEKCDIYTLEVDKVKPFDLLCAGFPCQPFSSAGHKKGFSDERGGMIFKILDLCRYHKPKYILLENVYNLLSVDGGKCIQTIVELFEELNYKVHYEKLNSKDFGCPQSRERVYIICTFDKSLDFSKLATSTQLKKISDIIDYDDKVSDIDANFINKLIKLSSTRRIHGCKISDKRGGDNNIHSWELDYNGNITDDEVSLMNSIMLERRKKHWAKDKNIAWMDGMPLTVTEIQTFFKHDHLQEMLNNLVKKKYLRFEKCKDIVGSKRVYKEDSESGYNICKGKLSFPISKILDPNDISPTLTATDSNKLALFIDNNVIRRLNILELVRICGFPDHYKIPKHVNSYDLFGNMATPPVIKELLSLIFN
jgi:DNA (cytosine-5)-methyltransferase 1